MTVGSSPISFRIKQRLWWPSGDTYSTLTPAYQVPQSSLDSASEDLKFSKAVKADDAELPVHLWDNRIFTPSVIENCNPVSEEERVAAANVLRSWGLRIYRRNLLRDCLKRLTKFNKKVKLCNEDGKVIKDKHGSVMKRTVPWWDISHIPRVKKNGEPSEVAIEMYAMREILWHASEATWFEYPSGSQINFFRFPVIYQQIARDGVRIHFEEEGPSVKEKQRDYDDEEMKAKVKKKLEKVVNRRYILEAGVTLKSLIKYFAVPKGEDDIRMVYDATRNQLNSAVWAPSFWLPTIDSITRALDSNSYMMDCDVGEQFLNFPLHKDVWPYTGLDLGPILDEKDRERGQG